MWFLFFEIRHGSRCFELDSIISLGLLDLFDTVERNRSASNIVNPTHPVAVARPNEKLNVSVILSICFAKAEVAYIVNMATIGKIKTNDDITKH